MRERAVRTVLGGAGRHGSRRQAIVSIAAKIGCPADTLDDRVSKAGADSGRRAGIPTEMTGKTKAPEREDRELRQANGILRKGETIVRHRSEDDGRAHVSRWPSPTAGRRDGGVR